MKKLYLCVLSGMFLFHSNANSESVLDGYLVNESCVVFPSRNFIHITELVSNTSIVVNLSGCPLEVKDILSVVVELNKTELMKFDLNRSSEDVYFSWLSNSEPYKNQFIFSQENFDSLKKRTSDYKYGQIFINALYD